MCDNFMLCLDCVYNVIRAVVHITIKTSVFLIRLYIQGSM